MSKAELEDRLERAAGDMGDMIEKLTEQQLRIAYLEGVVDGAGVKYKKRKRKGPLVTGPASDEEEMQKLLAEEFGDCEDECCCPICVRDREEVTAKFGEQKAANLKNSSKEISEWAIENDIEVDRGDCNDN